jgi:hypothetical protein
MLLALMGFTLQGFPLESSIVPLIGFDYLAYLVTLLHLAPPAWIQINR